uniref:AMMECR1 domain-containing protein n=1 Tax=Helicotheca tamesis TaxID=374047 RepID=A0A7S2H354_9STRA|mmetsp:Transcript_14878/g.20271  ORF Transcript_14878/g.20271 Transcript_14878/m.20271 type:complete len:285 (+) Transcript_14878:70-924(+)
MSPRDIERQDPDAIGDEESNTDDNTAIADDDTDILRATPEMCHYCFDLLVSELQPSYANGDTSRLIGGERKRSEEDPPFVESIPPSASCPVFVTWDKRRNHRHARKSGHSSSSEELFDLRGCIGTLAPRPLHTAIREYALTSAFRDRRFNPIDWQEVPDLRVAVSLLVKYEECSHCHDWVVGTHGIIIKFIDSNTHYNATYLPEVALEQGWTQVQAINSLVRKAGFTGKICGDFLDRVQCTRYQSSKQRSTYGDYVKTTGVDPFETIKQRPPQKQRSWRPCFNL